MRQLQQLRRVEWSQLVIELGPTCLLGAGLFVKLFLGSTVFEFGYWEPSQVASAAFATAALIVGPLCLCRPTPRILILAVVSLAVSVIVLADAVYFRRFRDIITVADLGAAPQLLMPFVAAAAIDLLRPADYWYFADIGLGLLIGLSIAIFRRSTTTDRRWRRRVAAIVTASGFIAGFPAALVLWQAVPRAQANLFRSELVGTIGLIPYHGFDLLSRAIGREFSPALLSTDEIREFLNRQQQPQKGGLFGAARRKNLILIQAESLLTFPIGLEVGGVPVAPRLAAFASESLNFTEFFDQTHGGGTSDGELTTLTSLHPLPESGVPFMAPDNHFRAVPQILGEAGYATLSACTATAETYLMSLMHPNYGFQLSFFEPDFEDVERFYWITDRQLFSQMLPRLTAQQAPFMAFLETSSNHAPYSDPARAGGLPLPEHLRNTILGDYLGSVHYFDTAFGELIDGLRQNGLLDSSVIAIYGDHDGLWDIPQQLPELVGLVERGSYDATLVLKRLPFLVRLPFAQGAGKRPEAGGHLDVGPTLLSLLGIDPDQEVMLGRDLISPGPSLVVFRDASFIDDEHLFVNRPFARLVECFQRNNRQRVGCDLLEAPRQQALDRLLVSDSIIGHDLLPVLKPSRTYLRPRDLPAPQAFSEEFGLSAVSITQRDIEAHVPSGATFSVRSPAGIVSLMFTPHVDPSARRDRGDGVTFEIWTGDQRLYHHHMAPGAREGRTQVILQAQNPNSGLRISFVTKAGPRDDARFDWAIWRDVQFVVGTDDAVGAEWNLTKSGSR